MTMINRCCPDSSAKLAFTSTEIVLLDCLIKNNSKQSRNKKLSVYLIKVAKLGGYLARASDLPPGNIVMWRRLTRLTDIELGFNMAVKVVSN